MLTSSRGAGALGERIVCRGPVGPFDAAAGAAVVVTGLRAPVVDDVEGATGVEAAVMVEVAAVLEVVDSGTALVPVAVTASRAGAADGGAVPAAVTGLGSFRLQATRSPTTAATAPIRRRAGARRARAPNAPLPTPSRKRKSR